MGLLSVTGERGCAHQSSRALLLRGLRASLWVRKLWNRRCQPHRWRHRTGLPGRLGLAESVGVKDASPAETRPQIGKYHEARPNQDARVQTRPSQGGEKGAGAPRLRRKLACGFSPAVAGPEVPLHAALGPLPPRDRRHATGWAKSKPSMLDRGRAGLRTCPHPDLRSPPAQIPDLPLARGPRA